VHEGLPPSYKDMFSGHDFGADMQSGLDSRLCGGRVAQCHSVAAFKSRRSSNPRPSCGVRERRERGGLTAVGADGRASEAGGRPRPREVARPLTEGQRLPCSATNFCCGSSFPVERLL
jgi:hypothetical protein